MAFSPYDNSTHSHIPDNEKPHACDMCCKCFSVSGHLKAHLHIQAKEKPNVCKICIKAFFLFHVISSYVKALNDMPPQNPKCNEDSNINWYSKEDCKTLFLHYL
ncbi:UNVERIFIED_CONTAM: zinc finger protein [Trichonephila clavipes]